HLCKGRELHRALSCALVRSDQPHLLAFAARVHGLGEGRHLTLGLLEVAEPKLGIARKSDPHRLVRRPFGEGRPSHGGRGSVLKPRRQGASCLGANRCETGLAGSDGGIVMRTYLLAAIFAVQSGIGLAAEPAHSLAEDAAAFGARESISSIDLSPSGNSLVFISPALG